MRIDFLPKLRKIIFRGNTERILKNFFPVQDAKIIALNHPDMLLDVVKNDGFEISIPKSIIFHTEIIIEAPGLIDLNGFLKDFGDETVVEDFDLSLELKRNYGKNYRDKDDEDSNLFDYEEGNKRCKHGLKKMTCSICSEEKKNELFRESSTINIFDLIKPILYPPLGENFNNIIILPPGKNLYNFQCFGVKFLTENKNGLLCDEMGLGKSIQAIMAIRLLSRRDGILSILILCPKSVLTDWERKIKEWAPEFITFKIFGDRLKRQIIWQGMANIYLTTYESFKLDSKQVSLRDRQFTAAKTEYDLVILDEIQKIKNPSTGTAKSVKKIRSDIKWGLSGTPLENKLEELIAVFSFIKPGLLVYEDKNRPNKVKSLIKPYILRRRKKEALPELPEKVYNDIWLELSEKQYATYEKAEKEGIIELNKLEGQDNFIKIRNVLTLITKLKQICNVDPNSKESCKVDYILDEVENITEQGYKAIIFSQYPKKTFNLIEDRFKYYKPLIFDGSLSEKKRDKIIEDFENKEENKLLFMSVKAGGLGLTITRPNYIFHLDLWWNPSVAKQAEDRAHRIGQKRTVFVTKLLTINTIEERIQNVLDEKQRLFDDMIDELSDTDSLKKILNIDELLGLFNLKNNKSKNEFLN